MTLNDWFEKGMTTKEYIDSMQVNREEMMGFIRNMPFRRRLDPSMKGLGIGSASSF